MKMIYIWKMIRKIWRFRTRSPFICHMPLACWTWNRPPLFHLSEMPNAGKTFPDVSPFTCNAWYCDRSPLALRVVMSCICVLYIYCFFPLFSLIDPETDAAPVIDYVPDDLSFSAEQPGKQNPLDHSYIAHSFSPMLALDFATVFDCSYSDA